VAGTALPGRLNWRVADVVETIPETVRATNLVLDVAGWSGHRPGQHVDVRLTAEDGYQAQRSYSIASAPDVERLALTIERIDEGEVSPYLTSVLEAGDHLELRGPIGGYFVWDPDDPAPVFLVAGGSGIVPLMSMMRHHAALDSDVPFRLVTSTRTIDALLYREELVDVTSASVEVAHTLTRAAPEGWTGYTRRVDAEMLGQAGWSAADSPSVFVCGPTPFVEAVASALVGLGHAPGRVKTERFGPTGG
jgi:ferredoxin-NADP reductase